MVGYKNPSMYSLGLLLLLLPSLLRPAAGAVGCRGPGGEAVEWWVIYKLPELPGAGDAAPGSSGSL